MLKQQRNTNLVNQSSMLTKKLKKQSSSTSRNKENISISHNQSSSIEGQDKCQINCNNKKAAMKEKSKKQMIAENKQRSISRISNQTSTLQFIQPTRIKNSESKQIHGANKKAKAKNVESHQFNGKCYIVHDENSQIDSKFHRKRMRNLLNKPEMSSSSTIMSVSTGNIQFSDRSKEEQKMRVFELPCQKKFDQVQIGLKQTRNFACSSSMSFKSRPKKFNPSKAAIMIQKTWRGYLTRKLLSEYIASFQPLYQQQLKQIRSSRQSCHEIVRFSTKRQHQRSSFFDEIENQMEMSLLQLKEVKKEDQSSSANNKKGLVGNRNNVGRDLPLQCQNNKVHVGSNCDYRSGSLTQQRSINSYQKGSNSKVSEFTIKNKTQSQQNDNRLVPHTIISNQQTMKIANRRQFKNFSLLTTHQLTINPSLSNSSPLDFLHYHCECLQKLFTSMKLSCISQLKREIKQNNLNLNELMERKDAIKDIVENGREFVKNVQEEMTKAFQEMKRITVNGCEQESSQRSSESGGKPQSTINSNHGKSQSPPSLHRESTSIQIPCLKFPHQYQFEQIQLPTQEYQVTIQTPPIHQQFYQQQELSVQESQSHIDMQYNDDNSSFKSNSSNNSQQNYNDNNNSQPLNQQSIEILNQFLVNLIDQYTQRVELKDISQLQYLCETLKRVSCDSQNKTIIDRCLIQFIVEIMSQTWTLRQIYDAFKILVTNNFHQLNKQYDHIDQEMQNQISDDWKLYSTIRRWLGELQKWEMNIINEVPARMESSSFINTTENLSFNQLRQSHNSPSNQSNLDI